MSTPTITPTRPARPQAPGRSSADLRRRAVRHYLPLALGSALVLVLFMNVAFFDANRYPPPGDIFTEGVGGAFPSGDSPTSGSSSSGGGGAPGMPPGMQHGPGQSMPPGMQHGPGQSMPGMQPSAGQASSSGGRNMDTALRWRLLSTGSGYIALGLLGLTLLIGPANLLLGRRNPVSSYLRRDVGIFAAIASIVHMVFGFLVKHQDGQILGYFFAAGDRSKILTNSFGLANWAGLLAVLIVAGLALISSDAALRKLKARRWKWFQRLNYALFVLAILHSVLYGALWRATSPYTVLLGVSVVAVAGGQALGVRLWRQKKKARKAVPA